MLDLIKKYKEILLYGVFGVLTTIVNLLIKNILLETILNPKNALQLQIAVIISWIVAVTFAYITNRIFVFESKNKSILKELSSFIMARIVTLLLEMFILWLFITLLKFDTKNWVRIWTIISQVLVIVCNYIFSKLFIFKKES